MFGSIFSVLLIAILVIAIFAIFFMKVRLPLIHPLIYFFLLSFINLLTLMTAETMTHVYMLYLMYSIMGFAYLIEARKNGVEELKTKSRIKIMMVIHPIIMIVWVLFALFIAAAFANFT